MVCLDIASEENFNTMKRTNTMAKNRWKKYLKKAGIEFRVWNPELNNEETGEDKNYA